ncbi:MAG: hypothetical protein M2R45_03560 [Verrucomicrobia subdivision 3 bacterium]|nr:hypothetical protein [Limisphaerales bacterium]MCS1416463.1 hypothetical protein [Limisphaerales bacterium]
MSEAGVYQPAVFIAFRHLVHSRQSRVRMGLLLSMTSLHCLSAFSSFTTEYIKSSPYLSTPSVFIAFRHLVHSRHDKESLRLGLERRKQCLHCLSAFSSFTTKKARFGRRNRILSLHCLSAFSSFTTINRHSCMPYSIESLHCLSAFSSFTTQLLVPLLAFLPASSLPFGI